MPYWWHWNHLPWCCFTQLCSLRLIPKVSRRWLLLSCQLHLCENQKKNPLVNRNPFLSVVSLIFCSFWLQTKLILVYSTPPWNLFRICLCMHLWFQRISLLNHLLWSNLSTLTCGVSTGFLLFNFCKTTLKKTWLFINLCWSSYEILNPEHLEFVRWAKVRWWLSKSSSVAARYRLITSFF